MVPINLGQLCIHVQSGRILCVTFPGGVEVCASLGLAEGDGSQVVRSFFGALNQVLAPLTPFLDVLDVVLAIVECVKAVPALVGVPPDPTKLFQCIPGLVEAVAKIIAIPLQIPRMIKQIVSSIVEGLLAILAELEAFIQYENDLLAAATAGAKPGNVVLKTIADCESANFGIELANLNASMKPLNRLIGVVNLILMTLTGQQLPSLTDIGTSAEEAITTLRRPLSTIQAILASLPF